MKNILIIFGTRPEAIKMAPLVKLLKKAEGMNLKICVTAQHREMLDQVLTLFDIVPDFDLNLMKKGQDLYDITSKVLLGVRDVLKKFDPDLVLVHGDTTTTSAASLASFYERIRIGHIEAGLRTNDIYNPWPEEVNRQITGVIANYHFAPTSKAKENLLRESKEPDSIIVTGNTVIDALFLTLAKINNDKTLKEKVLNEINKAYNLARNKKIILVTGHRRENFGKGLVEICEGLNTIAINNPDIDIIYPVHLNPNVQGPVNKLLSNIPNIFLISPFEYESFVYLMSLSFFIITDSGGVQEEAPSLGKPILVLRETTERPEAVEAGTVRLVGTDKIKIAFEAQQLIDNKASYQKMSQAHNPYGDGKAGEKIIDFIKKLEF